MALTSRNTSTDLINVHFDENRRRQGLTSKSTKEDEAGAVDDKSRKGSIDRRIVKLVYQINNISWPPESPEQSSVMSTSANEITVDESASPPKTELWNYFTTSSCSGRAILFTHQDDEGQDPESVAASRTDVAKPEANPAFPSGSDQPAPGPEEHFPQLRKANQKKGCKWLYVTHDEIMPNEFVGCWRKLSPFTYAVFKVEPSIFHIQCRTLTSARELVHVAASQSGFRNSGIVIGKDGKITVAVRSTIGLEVPLPVGQTEQGAAIVSDAFLEYLINTGNETLRQTWARTEKFANEFQKHFRIDISS